MFFQEKKTYWVRFKKDKSFTGGVTNESFEFSLEQVREFICLEGRMEGGEFVLFSRKSSPEAWISLTKSRMREKKEIYGNVKFSYHKNKS